MLKINDVYEDRIVERGEDYVSNVNYCIKIDDFLYAEVEGSFTYKTRVNVQTLAGDCSCPYGTNCKHAAAAYLVYKKGNYVDGCRFIEYLKSLSKEDLMKIIVDNLHNNPEIALDYHLKKSTDSEAFVNGLISDISYSKVKKAERILECFSFEHLVKMIVFLSENEGNLYDKVYSDCYEDENILYDFECRLEEELVKRIKTEEELRTAIEIEAGNRIIDNAESFVKFKDAIKSFLPKDEYLCFLLNLKNPDLNEIKKNLSNENRAELLRLARDNIELAERIAVYANDEKLLFLVAVYKGDHEKIIEYFCEFESIMDMNIEKFVLENRLTDIVDVFMKNHFKDENIIKKLLRRDIIGKYNRKQLNYLLEQTDDYDFIKKMVDFDERFSFNAPILERMNELDKENTEMMIKRRKDLLVARDWEDVVEILNFLKEKYGNGYVKGLIEDNESLFRTSSHLKCHLKDVGIFVSYRNGELDVKIKGG
ncbi:MAG: SWIM zinc finger family protein [archaeon]